MKLYEFPAEFERLLESITDCTDDGVVFDGLLTELDKLTSEFNSKVENCAKMVRCLNARVEAFSTEEKFFKAKRQSAEKAVEKLKEYVVNCMTAAGIAEVQGAAIKVKLCDNQPKLKMEADAVVPKKFLIKQEPKVDESAIKDLLLSGVFLKFARLEKGKYIRIS